MEKQNNVIEIAAGWWAARLQCLHHDNGGKEHVNQMAMFFADMLAASHKPTNDQLEKFKTALETCIKRERERRNYIYLSCDYSPDRILAEAAKEAGIDSSVFPYKVSTYITEDNKFMVRDGYGAPTVEVTEVPELI